VFKRAGAITEYRIVDGPTSISTAFGGTRIGDALVEVIDPVAAFAEPDGAARWISRDLGPVPLRVRMRFDALSAITSAPMPRQSRRPPRGLPAGTVLNGEPMPDFGGHIPTPNPVHAHHLMELMMGPGRARIRRGLGRGPATCKT
jgi:phosphoglucomutase